MNDLSESEIEQLRVGDEGPELVIDDITREDFVRFAGASGDFSRSHFDEPYVTEIQGDPSVYAQGMLIMSYASNMVTNWFGLRSVNHLDMRFHSRVWPGATLTISGVITEKSSKEAADIIEIEFKVTDDDQLIGTGNASVEFPR